MSSASPTLFTLGVEEEYMVIDPTSKELTSHEQRIVVEGQKLLKDKVKAEMHQAVVEVGTDICNNIEEAQKEVTSLRQIVSTIAGELNLWVGASGTHPFSHWQNQLITDHVRYNQIVNELQDAARSNLIFGLHVHVGMEDRKMAMHIANTARYFLPHVYPDYFETIEDYENYVNLLIKTNCIDNAKKIWWDVRVHPVFNTVEFRICDVPLTIKETTVIAALFQAICAKIYKLRHQNLNFMNYQRSLINENKWRASRYGIDGTLIDFGKETEVETKALIYELLDFVDDTLNDLGSRDTLSAIDSLFKAGTGADRQLAVFHQNNSLIEVVDYIHDQFLA